MTLDASTGDGTPAVRGNEYRYLALEQFKEKTLLTSIHMWSKVFFYKLGSLGFIKSRTYLLRWCLAQSEPRPVQNGIVHEQKCRTLCPAAASSGQQPCWCPSQTLHAWGPRWRVGRPGGTGEHSLVLAPRRPSWRTQSRQKPSSLEGNLWLKK